ncbi:hypothetical protein [Brevibacterium spongiae]|uniref:Lipoprotein n=1 Tax=Brevibacterium spongiae TaxID=2909672 RepID=A0ABY5SP20_9MICO|nr:hypothetical protein [Brevibacterium spongiae]UVI35885.1 hypothetical protein L1F31_17495 [Brevibacterium spongiae]
MISRSLRTVAAGAVLSLLLSGCSVLQIRTEDKDAGPIRVGVDETAGPEPTEKPTDAGIPEGMSKQTVNLGDTCPVDVSFALGDDWTAGAGDTERFSSFSRGQSSLDSDVIVVDCAEEFDDSAQSVVDTKRKFAFGEQDSQVLAERVGALSAGSYWSYQGELGPTEILAINQQATVFYGVETAFKLNGRLVSVAVGMRTPKTNAEAAEDFKKMLPTVTINGEKIPAPSFR